MIKRRQPRYQPDQKIGGRFRVFQAMMGGMGEVYLCLDELMKEPIALKTFQGTTPGMQAIFKAEVSSWIALEKHANIVQCYWMQTLDNQPFMGLEWVFNLENQGADLRGWLRNGPLALEPALRFTIDICRGLKHAGEKVPGIVHRDLKPDNVLVNHSQQAKITDFGLATVAQQAGLDLDAESGDDDLHRSRYVGNVVGTPPYMAPEQWRGEAALDVRTDIYAVGCILYELLTGSWIYDAPTIDQLRQQHLSAPLPSLNGDFPAAVQSILEGCLAKERSSRFANLDPLLAALNRSYENLTGQPYPEITAQELSATALTNRGMTYYTLGRTEEGLADLNEAIRLEPTLSAAFNNRAAIYIRQDRDEEALADLNEALRLDPTLAYAYGNRGLVFFNQKHYEAALADYTEDLRLNPRNAITYYNRGRAYAALGQFDKALADFTEAIRLNPADASAYRTRGAIHQDHARHEQALADYDESLRLNPENMATYATRGATHTALGHYEAAQADFAEALRRDPDYAPTYAYRGDLCKKQGRYEEALADFEEALRHDPALANAYNNRGTLYEMMGRYEDAYVDYTEAIRLDPDNPAIHYNRGHTYHEQGNYEAALVDYTAAIRLRPVYPEAYYNRGLTYHRQGRYEEALADYAEAIRLDPTDAEIYDSRGNTYADQQRYEEALADYTQALRLNPTYALAYFNRAVTYMEVGRYNEALNDYNAAIRFNPMMAQAYFNRGALYANARRLHEALPDFEKAYALGFAPAAGALQQVRQLLGMAGPAANNPQAAFDAFQRADSPDAMWQTVQQHPILAQMIPAIEQTIQQQVPPEYRPAFEQRLVWLRQVVKE